MKLALKGIFVAAFLLALAEATLRLAGFHFFPPFGNSKLKVEKVFSREGAILKTRAPYLNALQTQRIRLENPQQEFRIAIMGGSSAYNLGKLTELRTILHTHTNRFLPILNLGGVSYGTVRERMLMPELLEHKPNLLILYTGHNEFEENLLEELHLASTPLLALDSWLSASLRLYQGVSSLLHGAGGAFLEWNRISPVADAQRFRLAGRPNKAKVLELYRLNLEAMARMAAEMGVPLLLSTVAYHRLIPPFSPEEGNPYKQGRALFDRENFHEAAPLLEKGLDEDSFPHRATASTNQIVREVAAKWHTPLLDADEEIKKIAPHGIPGAELFDDHCHLNHKRGNRFLQRLFAAKILELGILPP